VPSLTPTALIADEGLLIVLRSLLDRAAPEEGCALLLGTAEDPGWRLRQVWPCCNVWPEPAERGHRFAVDPREQLVAQRWARERGLQVLGVAHSHPAAPAVPSDCDRQLCVPPALLVIQGAAGDLRGWWLAEQRSEPQPLLWRMVSGRTAPPAAA
jgi:proteasome lid subunit RPN8/RPN11